MVGHFSSDTALTAVQGPLGGMLDFKGDGLIMFRRISRAKLEPPRERKIRRWGGTQFCVRIVRKSHNPSPPKSNMTPNDSHSL